MTEQQHKALEPCPFCGSSDVRNVSSNFAGPSNHLHSGDKLFAVNCGDCGASVPNRYRNDLVISAWNRRAASAELRRLHAENEALRKDRDELLASLCGCLSLLECHEGADRGPMNPEPQCMIDARAAITKERA